MNYFYDVFYKALSVIPVSYVKFTAKTKPWITPVVIDIVNKRWRAFRQKNFPLYAHYKQKLRAEIAKCKRIWSDRMCSSPHGAWSVVKDVRGKNNNNSVDSIVALFSDPLTAAESINRIFSDVFVKSDSFSKLDVRNPVRDICNRNDVLNILRRLKTDKSGGSDGMSWGSGDTVWHV